MAVDFVFPENPGTSITFVGEETIRPLASITDIVAIPISHDWGPLGVVTEVATFGEFEATFGNSDTDGRDAVLGAFIGSGAPGEAAAGSVLVYRMAAAAADFADVTVQNTTPAPALTLAAKYKGTRGNRLSYAVEPDPADTVNRHLLRILLDGVTVERYTYAKTNITSLAASINTRPSKYVTATSLLSGTALATSAGTTFVGGVDGTPLTATEYNSALDALEFERFSILAFSNLTDGAIMATVTAWVDQQAREMRPVEVVFGASSTLDAAKTLVATIRNPHVNLVGAGTLRDDFLDKEITFAKFAPRYAGILAGRGETQSPLYAPIVGVSLTGTVEVSSDRIREASDAGITVLQQTSTAVADLVVQNAVTTFNDTTVLAMPYSIFSDPRQVRVIDLFIRRMKEWGDSTVISLPASNSTRATVKDHGKEELDSLINRGLIRNDPDSVPFFNVLAEDPANKDAILFEFGWAFSRTTRYLVGVGRIR